MMITVVVARSRPELFRRRLEAGLQRQVGVDDLQLVVEDGAPSIFVAYERGRRKARHEVVCYAHQDVELCDVDGLRRLADAARTQPGWGLWGVVGSVDHRYAPWWHNSPVLGHWLRPGPRGFVYGCASGGRAFLERDVACPEQALRAFHGDHAAGLLDGLLLVERARDMPWDTTLLGWHGYDIERCMQWRRAGMGVGVTDTLVLHETTEHTSAWHRELASTLHLQRKRWGLRRRWLPSVWRRSLQLGAAWSAIGGARG